MTCRYIQIIRPEVTIYKAMTSAKMPATANASTMTGLPSLGAAPVDALTGNVVAGPPDSDVSIAVVVVASIAEGVVTLPGDGATIVWLLVVPLLI